MGSVRPGPSCKPSRPNVTTVGIDVTQSVVGERWEIGTVTIEVSEPRVPCWRLGVRMEHARFVKRFTIEGRADLPTIPR
ncbi:MAG: MOSC domain-containing protein [Planctomycetota bacterium]